MGKWRKMTQDEHFLIFFSENKKRKTLFDFTLKNRNTYKFLALTIKNNFRNMSESGKFRFENRGEWC